MATSRSKPRGAAARPTAAAKRAPAPSEPVPRTRRRSAVVRRKIRKVLVANRGEIALRIDREYFPILVASALEKCVEQPAGSSAQYILQ